MTTRREDDRHWKIRNRPYIYAIVLALVMTMFLAPEVMEDDNMYPAIKTGDVVVLHKETYSENRGLPELGSVVVLKKDRALELTGDNLIARIVALPGETVEIRDGEFYRNGTLMELPDATGDLGEDLKVTLSEEEVFLLSDNLDAGMDSRSEELGPVPMSALRGTVLFRIWPITDLGGIN